MLVSHCLRSIVESSTYENYELVVVVDAPAEPALLEELREIGGERLRLVDYDKPFSYSDKINAGAAGVPRRAPAAAERRHRGRDAGLDRADGDVLGDGGDRRRRRPAGAPGRAPAARRRPLPERPARPPLLGLPRRLPRLRQRRPHRPELPRRHRRLPDDPARAVRATSAASATISRSTTTTSTTACGFSAAASGSSTTPTWR